MKREEMGFTDFIGPIFCLGLYDVMSSVMTGVMTLGQGLYGVMASLAKEQLMNTKLKPCSAEFALSEASQKMAENSKYFPSF